MFRFEKIHVTTLANGNDRFSLNEMDNSQFEILELKFVELRHHSGRDDMIDRLHVKNDVICM